MCGVGFAVGPKEMAVVAVGAVVLSPLIIVGAVGWFTVKGIAVGISALKKHNGKRFRDGARRMMKGVRHQIGREQLVAAILDLDAKIQQHPELSELYFQRASVKFLDLKLNSALLDLDTYLGIHPNAPNALMLKGKILSFYDRFDDADAAFKQAEAYSTAETTYTENGLPSSFTKTDARLSIAANRLRQIGKSEEFVSAGTVALIHDAEAALKNIDRSDFDSDTETAQRWYWMMGACNFYTYCQEKHAAEADAPPSLVSAIDNLSLCLSTGITNAEVLSLLSQCYRLRNDAGSADGFLREARESDPDVFVADYNDRSAMLVPWPVRNILPDGAEVRDHHDMQEKTFHRPTYCDVCNKFVHGSWFRTDRECSHCGMRVHAQCAAAVRGKCVADPKK